MKTPLSLLHLSLGEVGAFEGHLCHILFELGGGHPATHGT